MRIVGAAEHHGHKVVLERTPEFLRRVIPERNGKTKLLSHISFIGCVHINIVRINKLCRLS